MGACCEAAAGLGVTLDRNGQCCAGRLDACGVCNGSGAAVDVAGACCSDRLDAGAGHLTNNAYMCSHVSPKTTWLPPSPFPPHTHTSIILEF